MYYAIDVHRIVFTHTLIRRKKRIDMCVSTYNFGKNTCVHK